MFMIRKDMGNPAWLNGPGSDPVAIEAGRYIAFTLCDCGRLLWAIGIGTLPSFIDWKCGWCGE